METQQCGNSTSWECQLYDVQIIPELLAEKPEVQEVVGEKCRCGCIIHLDVSMPQRFLAASMRNCSRKTWWKIQVTTFLITLFVINFGIPQLDIGNSFAEIVTTLWEFIINKV